MRSALLLAAGCAFYLIQPGIAAEQFAISVQFSKPNVTLQTFQHDRNDCLGKAGHIEWSSISGYRGLGGSTAVPGRTVYSVSRFGRCMLAKGYQLDPNGFLAAKFWRFDANKYRLIRT